MTDRTDAIKAAISATAPNELQWLPNPGEIDAVNASIHACNSAFGACPEPQRVRAQPTLDQALEQLRIEAERIQQPNPQPTLERVTPVTEDAHELLRRAVLGVLADNTYGINGWKSVKLLADCIGESISDVRAALADLVITGAVEFNAGVPDFYRLYRQQTAKTPEPIRKQSGALVISGRLTAVGENFATILTGTRTLADQLAGVSSQQVTLGIGTEQARWFGKYVGGEVKLTVEVQL